MKCPSCEFEYPYEEDGMMVCPVCQFRFDPNENTNYVLDAYATKLYDGDDVIIIKDLPVKGSSNKLKQGTKVRSIRIVDGDHNIDCKIDGFGKMSLKSEFVKKA